MEDEKELTKEEKLEELKKKHERTIKRHEKKEENEKRDDMLRKLSENVNELQNKLLFQQAEFQNFRRHKEEEMQSALKYKNYDFALELLGVVDSLERAIKIKDNTSDEIKAYLNGFVIIYNNLINIMNKFEIKEIDCLGKTFDHNLEEALMTEKREGIEEGIVLEVLQKGYLIKDKLLRASLVKVSE